MDPITTAEDETVTPVTDEASTEEILTEATLQAVLLSFVVRIALESTKEIRE